MQDEDGPAKGSKGEQRRRASALLLQRDRPRKTLGWREIPLEGGDLAGVTE